MTAHLFFAVLAIVFLGLATFNCPAPRFLSFGWAGLFLLALIEFVPRLFG